MTERNATPRPARTRSNAVPVTEGLVRDMLFVLDHVIRPERHNGQDDRTIAFHERLEKRLQSAVGEARR
jgi:hypothetical protein